MAHITPLALKQSLRILQRRSIEEAELHASGIRINVRDGPIPANPAPVTPLHSLAQPWLNAFHELPKRADDLLILGSLILKVIIEAPICLHLLHQGSFSSQ